MTAEALPDPIQKQQDTTERMLSIVRAGPDQVEFEIPIFIKKIPERLVNGVTILVGLFEQAGLIVPENSDDIEITQMRFKVIDRINLANLYYREVILSAETGLPDNLEIAKLEEKTNSEVASSKVLNSITSLMVQFKDSPLYLRALEQSEILARLLILETQETLDFA